MYIFNNFIKNICFWSNVSGSWGWKTQGYGGTTVHLLKDGNKTPNALNKYSCMYLNSILGIWETTIFLCFWHGLCDSTTAVWQRIKCNIPEEIRNNWEDNLQVSIPSE